ncbi:unnamed protein product [Ceratitis capitata]|uniref:(Mediterranean fruit fly) hypothetical protein n=1 Tax=Ceratitis capitata TaxID=7213 RepID=A0A811UVX3_CERCA|nr:unnamed protein product [Ceratitis capitata]
MNADITNVTSNENTANADVNLEAPRQTVNATKHENGYLLNLPDLKEGFASSWWQDVKHEAETLNDSKDFLRTALFPQKPDWRIFRRSIKTNRNSLNLSTHLYAKNDNYLHNFPKS